MLLLASLDLLLGYVIFGLFYCTDTASRRHNQQQRWLAIGRAPESLRMQPLAIEMFVYNNANKNYCHHRR